MHSGESRQEEVLQGLGLKGLIKLFAGLEAAEVQVRKTSAKLICELAFQNDLAQMVICEVFSFLPLQGKICINGVPAKLQRLFRSSPHLLSALKKSDMPQGKYWCFPPIDMNTYRKSLADVELFPDPKDFMVGFNAAVKTRAPFIDTTTSFLSDVSAGLSPGTSLNVSKEEVKSRGSSIETSPAHFNSVKEPTSHLIRRQLKPPATPVRASVQSRGSSQGSSSRGNSPAHIVGRFKTIEDSLQRIRTALEHKVEWPGSKTERYREPRTSAYTAVTEAFKNKRKSIRKSSPEDSFDSLKFKNSEEAVLEIIRSKRKQLVKKLGEKNMKPPLTPPRSVSPLSRERVATRPPFRV